MISIPMRSTGAYDRNTITSINQKKVQTAQSSQTILTLNVPVRSNGTDFSSYSSAPASSVPQSASSTTRQAVQSPVANAPIPVVQPAAQSRTQTAGSAVPNILIPQLVHPIQKGQKSALENGAKLSKLDILFGWNVTNPQCDVDVSAFLLGDNGKVLGESWFVFYGQPDSPDKSVSFSTETTHDREKISVNFNTLNPSVKKIVFVLTINDACEKKLNFSMLKDAYIRLINTANNQELASFKMNEYYSNVISMMIGEVYLYNGQWKFNAVGNGVDRDLAGLCELYGVEVM